ncbi:MAG: ankyrin repeat domain-containing protein [Vicinamibacteraceae bacterium]
MRARFGVVWCVVAVIGGCAAPRGRQLCDAIAKRDVATVQRLLAGPELNATRTYGTCVPADVFTVARPGDTALTAIGVELVKAGLPADASWIPLGQSEPVSAIETAARNGNVELVRALLAVGLDLTSLASARALVQAAGAGHLPVVRLLVQEGIDLEATSGGETALDRARAKGQDEVLRFLEDVAAARHPAPDKP